MSTPRFTRLAAGGGILDRETGLVWELPPRAGPVTWEQARAGLDGAWRLPSISELVGLLVSLPAQPFPEPVPGSTFWTVSESPFAPATFVRAVTVERGPRPVVRLLAKTVLARPWRVRAAGPAEATNPVQAF